IGGGEQRPDHRDQGRLARAGRAQQPDELVAGEVEGCLAHGGDGSVALAVDLGEPLDFEGFAGHAGPPRALAGSIRVTRRKLKMAPRDPMKRATPRRAMAVSPSSASPSSWGPLK